LTGGGKFGFPWIATAAEAIQLLIAEKLSPAATIELAAAYWGCWRIHSQSCPRLIGKQNIRRSYALRSYFANLADGRLPVRLRRIENFGRILSHEFS
jgi:hypothetical protein